MPVVGTTPDPRPLAPQRNMKKITIPALVALSALLCLTGCVAAIGNRDAQLSGGTLGQQLIDLQKAKEAGAITELEYQTQKARLLEHK